MGAFDMLRIAGSSLGAHQTWLDSLAANIANINTIRSTSGPAYQATTPIVGSRTDGGVAVVGIAQSDPVGRLVYDPTHPLADAQGYVRAPEVDMASQMSQLIMAQRGFQASVQVTKDAQDTYQSALQIGRA
ncbi:MAG: flagellar basal body rod C-terminal domain-containing protein [Nocardioidaceae bacterium]